MNLLQSGFLPSYSVASSSDCHPSFVFEEILVCCNNGPASVHDGFDLRTHSAVVNWSGKDNPICIPEKFIEFLQIIFENAISVLEAIVTVCTETDVFAANRPKVRLNAFGLDHTQ
jgi:hypothetical protein